MKLQVIGLASVAIIVSGISAVASAASDEIRPSWHSGNTGVEPGTQLSAYDGDLVIKTPGTVIENLDIKGIVTIDADRVTIRDSIVRGGPIRTRSVGLINAFSDEATNYRVENVTLLPSTPDPNFDGMKLGRTGIVEQVDISKTVDGIVVFGSGIAIVHSYIHDLSHFAVDPNQGGSPSHDDDIQVQSGSDIRIEDNTLIGAHNAAVMVTQDDGPTTDLVISRNWIDDGGCSLNFGSKGDYKTGMQAAANVFGRDQRNPGCAIIHNAKASDLLPVGNIWLDGTPAGIKNGA